ncbi:MAG: peptidase [Deltaproteobacteria bacterium]|nr:peptidase [Deltaproteobacteria bacterium]
MAWTVTLEIVDCDSTSTPLVGATIFDGTNTWNTDANGQLIYIVADDFITSVIVKIGKTDYIEKNYTISKMNDGTIQTVCLNTSPIPPGHDPSVPTGEGQEFGNGCFIVTATTGSSESVEVNHLRNLRDRVSAASMLGGQLIDVIYDEYFQFSPAIAAELQQNAFAKGAVLQNVVRPLLAWYTLAGVLALGGADQKAVNKAARDVLNACPQHLGKYSIISLLNAIREGEALPTDTPSFLLKFAPKIQEAARFPFASWAILDPLVRVWRSVTDRLDVVDEVAQWLATAPLEELDPPSDLKLLDAELGVLGDFFDFRPAVRPQLGERLLVAWPDASGALKRAGLVLQTTTSEKEQ